MENLSNEGGWLIKQINKERYFSLFGFISRETLLNIGCRNRTATFFTYYAFACRLVVLIAATAFLLHLIGTMCRGIKAERGFIAFKAGVRIHHLPAFGKKQKQCHKQTNDAL